ncbi:5'-methylthioadenosine/S-adenosylhomocysteine nucleosidase [Bifidobacterium vansinderenii]|uniref:adenosylhomocysteine nucleosidase n=1 Tax=Bifidobacterium vansinderenii TaxID=1984871 RepID=A0A229VWY3_9BIFI|nr:5'-methylthioadenosine/S-adenosylhomocysteine nucleosidase [Bifidobacterium vansinderenii]OXN00131.1 5'-methylthioadenosine nucleosidase [Bifidobacterium vansinderenii]
MSRTIAIIGAMDEEVAFIARSLTGAATHAEAGLNVTEGTFVGGEGETLHVVATVAGMGTVNAAATTQHLIDVYSPEAVIFSGIAGNLNKDLHINDVVLGGTLRYLDTDMRLIAQSAPKTDEFHSDPHLLAVAGEALDEMGITHITGVIATGNYFVEGDENTAKVKAATGADAVEMEGAAVAHVAARNEVPALVIRALSDNADTEYETFKDFDISEYADTAAKLVINILGRL